MSLETGLQHTYSVSDIHQKMANMTSRLAVKIKNVPPASFSWSDKSSQGSRSSLKAEDIIPNEEDGEVMSKCATAYIMRFLVGFFKGLKHLENLVPKQHSPHPVSKSQVAPMKILDVDEKYTQGNLDILDKLRKDIELSDDDHQVIYLNFIIYLPTMNV